MKIKIPSDFKKIIEVSRRILQSLKGKNLSNSFLFDVRLACEEAMINAIKYGNELDACKTVTINCDVTAKTVVITVEDEGKGFNYHDLPDPTKEENLLKEFGRGLFLIHNVMDKVEFNTRGNKISMTKFLPNKGVKNADKTKRD